MGWFVYMIESEKGKIYTGITTDVERRFNEHKSKKCGAKFFHSDPPKRIVHVEEAKDRSEASKREAAIKKLTRAEKLKLIGEI